MAVSSASRAPLNRILTDGLVPLWGGDDQAIARAVARAIHDSGLGVFEFTMRTPEALVVLTDIVTWARDSTPGLVVGAGTVTDAATARQAVRAGAQFVFSPMIVDEVADVCAEQGIPYVPGCATMTEIHRARTMGSEVVKLFPASTLGGPAFLSAVRAACPWVQAIPTGGVEPTAESIAAWFGAGAVAVGLGSQLFPSDSLGRGDFSHIRERLHGAVEAVRAARSGAVA